MDQVISLLFDFTYLFTAVLVIYMNIRANKMASMAVEETQKARQEAGRPYVFFKILIEEKGNVINFALVNKGQSVAKDVQIKLSQTIYIDKEKNRTHEEMGITKPIWALPPGSDFKEFVNITRVFFRDNKETKIIEGEITYKDTFDKEYKTPLRINLEVLGKKRMLIEKDWEDVIREVEEIQRVLERKRR